MLSFVLLILGLGFVLSGYLSPAGIRLAQDKQYAEILSRTREAVIAFVVAESGPSQTPGQLPRPDVVANTASTKTYDGVAESGCFDQSKANGLPLIIDDPKVRCIGRFPWRNYGLSSVTSNENDPTGTMPWYAVSANLSLQGCFEFFNSDTINFSHTADTCPAHGVGPPDSLPYPWLTVRDARGVVLSDRVAVVIIVPGPPLNGQSRPPAPNLGGANQYLDSITVTVTNVTPECPGPPCTLTFNNADLDNDFIQAEPSATFNDRLIYITIDEIMAPIEARAGQEIRASVERFRTQYGSYPWLAPYADPNIAASYVAAVGTRSGLIPFYRTGQSFQSDFTWSVTGGTIDVSGTVNLNEVRNALHSIVSNGTCVWRTAKTVECSGDIPNPDPTKPTVVRRNVQIEYPPAWTNQVVTTTAATATTFTTRQVTRANGSLAGCLTTSIVRCVIVRDYSAAGNLIGDGELRVGTGSLTTSKIRMYPELPDWIMINRWHSLAVGVIASGWVPGAAGACPCLSAKLDGTVERNDLRFLVMMAGATLAGQTYPRASLNDYFDNANNRNIAAGQAFDRQSARSAVFNDNLFF